MNHGLSEKTVNKISSVFERFPEIEKAVLYGSRAKGNFKTGSDIDLTLYGEKLSSRLLGDIAEALDDLLLPYTIDLSIFDELNHAKLREHIERVGVVFYEKKNQNMKAGWEIKTLGEVYDVRDGTHDSPKYHADGFPLITSKNLKQNGLSFDDVKFISEQDYKQINQRSAVHKGDVLFAMIGTIGNPTLVEIEPNFAIKNVALFKVSNHNNGKFLKYYLESEFVVSKMISEAKGTTQKFVGLGYLREFPIPLPLLPEQKRLVTLLDEAFESIATAKANAQQNLKNARALFESHLNEVFTKRGEGWEEKTLGEVCNFSQGIQVDVKLQHEIKTADNQVRFLRIVDFTQGNEPERYINNSDERFLVSTSDVSLVRYGASTGFVCRGLEGAIANNLFRVIPQKNYVSNGFLYWFLNAPLFQEKIKNRMNGAAMPAISFGMINDIEFPFPSSSEQQQLVSTFDTIYKETQHLEALYSRKIATLDELKKALLHRAFSGEL
jgi:type I restriction enzyme S subunit